MAATINNDPEAIHNYRGKILDSIGKLEEQLRKTEISIENVSESWRDSNFQEFQKNFNNDKDLIRPLCKALKNYDELLWNLEQKLNIYKNSRMHL